MILKWLFFHKITKIAQWMNLVRDIIVQHELYFLNKKILTYGSNHLGQEYLKCISDQGRREKDL